MTAAQRSEPASLAAKLVAYLETHVIPDGLFAPDVFCDFTLPSWRLEARGIADVHGLRTMGHPSTGRVTSQRVDVTDRGFLLEIEERWDAEGDRWYCRELIRAEVRDGAIAELSVYCGGDWSSARQAEHARSVTLLRA